MGFPSWRKNSRRKRFFHSPPFPAKKEDLACEIISCAMTQHHTDTKLNYWIFLEPDRWLWDIYQEKYNSRFLHHIHWICIYSPLFCVFFLLLPVKAFISLVVVLKLTRRFIIAFSWHFLELLINGQGIDIFLVMFQIPRLQTLDL